MSIAKKQEGFGVRLTPVEPSMSDEILELRRPAVAQGFLGVTSATITEQQKWIKKQQSTEADYYWAVGNRHLICQGTISIYDSIRDHNGRLHGEWGRWVIRPHSHMALASFVLMLQTAFDVLGYEALKSATVATNHRALNFHRRFGTPEVGVVHRVLLSGAAPTAMVEHCVRKEDWNLHGNQWRASALSLSHLAAEARQSTSKPLDAGDRKK